MPPSWEGNRGSSFVSTDAVSENSVEITLERLDDVFDDDITINLAKFDVEGHEFEVLEGCSALFDAGRVATAVVEVFPGEGAGNMDRILQRWNPRISCWLNESGTQTEIPRPTYRTDVLLEFDR
mgnify:CR=1 FL=1